MIKLPFLVLAYCHAENVTVVSAHVHLSRAIQDAKQSAILEGYSWEYHVVDAGGIIAICDHKGNVATPRGISQNLFEGN